jgi:hypothetical protein
MYQKPTVPRSIGGVLDDTFQLYKASFSSCWQPMLIITLIGLASGFYRFSAVPAVAAAGTGLRDLLQQFQATPRGYRAVNLLVMVVNLVLYAALLLNIVAVSRGAVPSFGASLTAALRRAPALIVAAIIFFIAVVVGFILLIVPGFYLANRLQLFVVPLVTESQGPVESLGTSWNLVGGHWWRTATLMFVMLAIMYVLDLALVALAGAVVAVAGGGAASLARGAGAFVFGSLILTGLVGIFTTPLFVTVFVTVYQDLVLRKGGGDLEARLGALPQG